MPDLRTVRSSQRQTGIRARTLLSSRRMPTAETTSPVGNRLRIALAITALLSSAVQNRVEGVLQGSISFTHSRFAYRSTLACHRESQRSIMSPACLRTTTKFDTEPRRQSFAHRQQLTPLDPAQVAVDQQAGTGMTSVVEVVAQPVGQGLRVLPAADADEHRRLVVERRLDLGRGRHIEPGQRHLIGEEVGLPA